MITNLELSNMSTLELIKVRDEINRLLQTCRECEFNFDQHREGCSKAVDK